MKKWAAIVLATLLLSACGTATPADTTSGSARENNADFSYENGAGIVYYEK